MLGTIEREEGATAGQRAFLPLLRPIGLLEGTAVIAVPDDFTRNQIEGRLRAVLVATLCEALGEEVQLAVTVDPDIARQAETTDPKPAAPRRRHERLDDVERPAAADGLADEPKHAYRNIDDLRPSDDPFVPTRPVRSDPTVRRAGPSRARTPNRPG